MWRELILDTGTLSQAMLARRVEEVRASLREAGVAAGHVLAAPADDVLLVTLLRLALKTLDAGLLVLPPERQDLQRMLDDWGIEWHWHRGGPRARMARGGGANGDAPGLLVMSSGSTGQARGVMLSEAALEAAAVRVNARLELGSDDTWLGCLPLHHVGGLAIAERCRLAGAGLWLQARFDPLRLAQALASGRITHLSLVPAMLWRLLEADVKPPDSLRVALIGGQALSPALAGQARQAGWPLHVSYGASETGGMVACESGAEAGAVAGRVGSPLPGVEARSVNGGGLSFRGPMLMSGYANGARRPGEGLEDGWFVSGDLGSLDPQGRLWVRGRRDDVLVSAGENIHPQQVEQRLSGIGGLGEVALSGVPDPVWGMRLVLFYTGPASPRAAEALCRERLSGALRPRCLVRVASLPQLRSGKLDRRRLGRMAAGHC